MGRQPVFRYQPKQNGLVKKTKEEDTISSSNTGLIIKGELK